jgi:hypothetical protein
VIVPASREAEIKAIAAIMRGSGDQDAAS